MATLMVWVGTRLESNVRVALNVLARIRGAASRGRFLSTAVAAS